MQLWKNKSKEEMFIFEKIFVINSEKWLHHSNFCYCSCLPTSDLKQSNDAGPLESCTTPRSLSDRQISQTSCELIQLHLTESFDTFVTPRKMFKKEKTFDSPTNQSIDDEVIPRQTLKSTNKSFDTMVTPSNIFKTPTSPRLSPATPATPVSSESKKLNRATQGLMRSDFTSEEAWQKYRLVVLKSQEKLKIERKKGKQKEESGKKLKAIIQELKEKEFSGGAEFFEVNK